MSWGSLLIGLAVGFMVGGIFGVLLSGLLHAAALNEKPWESD